ncbi:MAG: KGG domain-containing protein [Pseudomonadota bacterium]
MAQRRDGRETSNRGFASMDPQKQREIASKGGQSVPNEKRSFSKNRTLASEAGRKGGQSVDPEDRSFSQDRELAAQAGRKGGEARGGRRPARKRTDDPEVATEEEPATEEEEEPRAAP